MATARPKIEEIPAALAEPAKAAHEALVEMVAEGDDALMQEFFDKGTLPVEDLKKGLREAVLAKRIFPVLLSSALHNIGSDAILNFLVEIFPSPAARGKAIGPQDARPQGRDHRTQDCATPSRSRFSCSRRSPIPFAGRITYFKVMSGVLKNDATLQNFNRGSQERFQHIQVMQGKTAVGRDRTARRRSSGAVAKLKETITGETLGDKSAPIFYPPARIPEPSITFADRAEDARRRRSHRRRRFTKFSRRIWRCASRAIRRRRNFC